MITSFRGDLACGFRFLILITIQVAGAWKGAFWSWGYLKSLHNRKRFGANSQGFDQHIPG